MALSASEKSSTGLDANLAGMLAYFVIPAFIFLLMKETSRFVRYHSMQAIILWVTSILISIVLRVAVSIPFIGLLVIPIWMLVALGLFLVWIFCMFKAFQGEEYKLPVIGDLAVQNMDKI
jgi:uncharacterized membrane protein